MKRFYNLFDIEQAYLNYLIYVLKKVPLNSTESHKLNQIIKSIMEENEKQNFLEKYWKLLSEIYLKFIKGNQHRHSPSICALELIILNELETISELCLYKDENLNLVEQINLYLKKIKTLLNFGVEYESFDDYYFCKHWEVADDPQTHPKWMHFVRNINPDLYEEDYLKITVSLLLRFGLSIPSQIVNHEDLKYNLHGIMTEFNKNYEVESLDTLEKEKYIWKPENIIKVLINFIQNYAAQKEVEFDAGKILDKAKELKMHVLTPLITLFLNKLKPIFHLSPYSSEDITHYQKRFDDQVLFFCHKYIYFSSFTRNPEDKEEYIVDKDKLLDYNSPSVSFAENSTNQFDACSTKFTTHNENQVLRENVSLNIKKNESSFLVRFPWVKSSLKGLGYGVLGMTALGATFGIIYLTGGAAALPLIALFTTKGLLGGAAFVSTGLGTGILGVSLEKMASWLSLQKGNKKSVEKKPLRSAADLESGRPEQNSTRFIRTFFSAHRPSSFQYAKEVKTTKKTTEPHNGLLKMERDPTFESMEPHETLSQVVRKP